jgi:hypothetical protein
LCLRVSKTSIPNTKFKAGRFSRINVFGSIPGLVLKYGVDYYTIGYPSDGIILPFNTISVELSRSVIAEIEISTMGKVGRSSICGAIPPVELLDTRRLSVEIMRGPMGKEHKLNDWYEQL